MNKEQIMSLPNTEIIVLCADGMCGLLTIFPAQTDLCGIQVPGEDEHRWVSPEDLSIAGEQGVLKQKRATPLAALTTLLSREIPDTQKLLLSLWLERAV